MHALFPHLSATFQKSWKQKIAAILVCALVTGTISTNTAFASGSRSKIAIDNILTEASHGITKDGIKKGIGEEQNSPEWNKILENCKEVKADKSFLKLKRGESMSVESISGNYTKMAILSNGDLYCWGYNGHGQVGNGTTKTQLTPIKVLSDVKSVSYSYYSSSSYPSSVAAILSNGDLYCWGYNWDGQVGNGTRGDQLTPVKVSFGDLSGGDASSQPPSTESPSSGSPTPPVSSAAPSDESISKVARFTLSETASGTLDDGQVMFSGRIYLEDGTTANDEQWKDIANSIKWISNNPSVVTSIKCLPIIDGKEYNDISIIVYVSVKSVGAATVTGTTANELTASCEVTVTDNNNKCGDHLTWTLDDEGTLTISGTGDMWDFDDGKNSAPWSGNKSKIEIIEY